MNKLYKKKEQEKEKAKNKFNSVSSAIIISSVKVQCGEGRVYM